MSNIWMAGFDLDTNLAHDYVLGTSGSSPQVITGAARNGTNGMRIANNSAYLKKLTGPITTFYVGFAMRVNSYDSSAAATFLSFNDGASVQVDFSLLASGIIQITRNGTLLVSSTVPIATGPFHFYEARLTIDGTTGVAEIKVDTVVAATFSGNTKATSNTTADTVILGEWARGSNGASYDYDDWYINTSAGSVNNGYLGDCKVIESVPNANGTTNQYTQGGTTHTNNFQQVDEIPPDDDTTYITDATVGHLDRYTFPTLTAATVFAVAVKIRADKDDVGARAIRAAVKSSSTLADNGADFALTQSSYQNFQGIFENDPNTSAAWTAAGVNAAEFGVKTTV